MIRNAYSWFDVCLVCATSEEAKVLIAVISDQCNVQFTNSRSERYDYMYYYATIENNKGEPLTIHVSSQSGYGPVKASEHSANVLKEYNPRFVGMTGVCAGDKRKKVKLGDLIIANYAFMYDDVMVSENPQQQDHQVVKYYANIDSTYFDRVCTQFGSEQKLPRITPMACVKTVRRDEPFHNIQTLVPDTLALDMEGASFYEAVSSLSSAHSLVVKGVCDYADSEKNDEYLVDASKISAEYMVCFIKDYVTSDLAPAFLFSADS